MRTQDSLAVDVQLVLSREVQVACVCETYGIFGATVTLANPNGKEMLGKRREAI